MTLDADIRSYGLFIDGSFGPAADVDQATEPTGEVGGPTGTGPDGGQLNPVNPATEQVLAEVASAGPRDVDRAVAAARAAYERVWRPMPSADRAKYLFRIARLVQDRAGELAVLETLNSGKPIRESRLDLAAVAAHFFYYAGWADKLRYAGFGPDPRPLGVAAQVIPWNSPLLMLAWAVAPALACGNAVVVKPSEHTPLTALRFAEICQQADLPPGVVNIVTGTAAASRTLVSHSDVDVVAFAGSTARGREVARLVAGGHKRLNLALGGKATNIVFDDAPLDEAVEAIANGMFANVGPVRCAGARLLAQESIVDELLDRVKHRVSQLQVGDPMDKNTDIGPVNSAQELARIRALFELDGQDTHLPQESLRLWSPPVELPRRGYWFPPTICTGVTQAHRVAREEVSGPLLAVLTFRTPAEAVQKANNTPYGLSAGVWTEKGSRMLAITSQLRAGVVWANTFNKFDPAAPFGGVKESGYGRAGGRHGLEAYLA